MKGVLDAVDRLVAGQPWYVALPALAGVFVAAGVWVWWKNRPPRPGA